MYQALYRKYRPKAFDDVVGQQHVTETLKRQLENGKTSHAYLFVGTRGTGKTTCAKILSKAINCEHPVNGNPCNECASCRGIDNGTIMDVEEIDAASNNKVEHIRAIREEAIFSPAATLKRVYIIDEVHMLTKQAFNALLKILEEPPEHLVFILATTEVRSIPATILSRCQRFTFRRLTAEDIEGRLNYVTQQEGLDLTPGAASLLARLADGAMRDALSLLDQCASSETVDEVKVLQTIGLSGKSETADLLSAVIEGNVSLALDLFAKLYLDGKDAALILNELASLCREIMLRKVMPKGSPALMGGRYSAEELSEMGARISVSRLISIVDTIHSSSAASLSADKRTAAEICLVKLCGVVEQSVPAPVVKSEPAAKPAAAPAPVHQAPVAPVAPAAPIHQESAPVYVEPVPVYDEPVSAPAPAGGGWAEILNAARVDLGPEYHLISGPSVSASISGKSLEIVATESFTADMIDKDKTKKIIADAAEKVLGFRVIVSVKVGSGNFGAGTDRLAALKKFGNVKFE